MTRRLGEYRIVREIGRGGFGVVYEAIQEPLGRRVALKIYHAAFALDPEQRERFDREARIAARLDHPHILPVLKIGEVDGTPYLAMEHVEGCSLEPVIAELRSFELRRIRRATFLAAVRAVLEGRRLDQAAAGSSPLAGDANHAETVAQLVLQAAGALGFAHDHGVVHRDVKPANLLLRNDGHLFVADFGLARDETLATLTRTGEFQGTPHYLSPEQTLADRHAVDHRSDIYSLGAVLWALLTLRAPHQGSSSTDVIRDIVFRDVPPPSRLNPAVPHELDLVVGKAMQRDPADRYASMQELSADLQRFLAHEAVLARPLGILRRAKRIWSRRPGLHATCAAGLGLAVVAALVLGHASRVVRAEYEETQAAQRDRQASLAGALRAHLEGGRLEEAARLCASSRGTETASPQLAACEEELLARARALGAELVEAAQARPLAASPRTLVDLAARLRRLHALLPEASDRVPFAAALGWLAEVERALALHPAVEQMLVDDPARAADATAVTIALLLREGPPMLELVVHAGQSEERLVEGRDFTIIHRGESPLLASTGIVFAGWAIDSGHPPWRDFAGLDVAGHAVLCLRHCPQYDRDDGLFGGQAGRTAVSGFAAKAKAAYAAGARVLVVVNRPVAGGDDLVRSARFPQAAPIPVVHVARGVADAWLRHAGRELGAVYAELEGELRPGSFPLPLTLSIRERIEAGSKESLLQALMPFLAGRLAAAPTDGGSNLRRLRLGLVAMLSGGEADEVLRRALAGGDVLDQAWVCLRLQAEPRPGFVPDLLRVARHENHGLIVTEVEPRSPLLDGMTSEEAGERWRRWRERGVLAPAALSIHRYFTLRGCALAALHAFDPQEAASLARDLVLRGEWVAVEVLRRARSPGLGDLLVGALHALGDLDPTATHDWRVAEQRAIFLAVAGDVLADLGDRRGLPWLLRLLEDRAASPIHYDLEHVIASVGRYETPEGAPELLSFYLHPWGVEDRMEDAVDAAAEILVREPRLARILPEVERILGEDDERRIAACLELLGRAVRPSWGAALEARLDALAGHASPRIAEAAAVARADAHGLIASLLRALAASGSASDSALAAARDALLRAPEPLPAREVDALVSLVRSGARRDLRSAAAAALDAVLLAPKNLPAVTEALRASLAQGTTPEKTRVVDFVAKPGVRAFGAALHPELQALLDAGDPDLRRAALAAQPAFDERTRAATLRELSMGEAAETAAAFATVLAASWAPQALDDPSLLRNLRESKLAVDRESAMLMLEALSGLSRRSQSSQVGSLSAAALDCLREVLGRAPAGLGRAAASQANTIAWRCVDPANPKPGTERFALLLAEIAVRETQEQDAAPLDTLAAAWHMLGDHGKAVGFQEKALRFVPDAERAPYEQRLALFRAAQARAAGAERK